MQLCLIAGLPNATARCAGSGASDSRLTPRRQSHAEYRRAFLADAFAGTGEGSREQFFSSELDPVLAALCAASSPRAARDPKQGYAKNSSLAPKKARRSSALTCCNPAAKQEGKEIPMSMNYQTEHIVYFPDGSSGQIYLSRYSNMEIALLIVEGDSDEDDYSAATVALVDARHVGPTHVWLKGWSENVGVPESLEAAGLVRLTGETCPTGFAHAQLAEVLPPLSRSIAAYLKKQR
jgi:hypothetical protein